jgi:hypothetical protein
MLNKVLGFSKNQIVEHSLKPDKLPRLTLLESDEEPEIPISLERIKRGINAHKSLDDDEIRKMAFAACLQAEADLDRSILFKKFELIHQRPDVILMHPHIRRVNSVHLRVNRGWVAVPEEQIEKHHGLNGGYTVVFKNWQQGQKIKIVYEAGHKLDDSGFNRIPLSTERHIIHLCWQFYINDRNYKDVNQFSCRGCVVS